MQPLKIKKCCCGVPQAFRRGPHLRRFRLEVFNLGVHLRNQSFVKALQKDFNNECRATFYLSRSDYQYLKEVSALAGQSMNVFLRQIVLERLNLLRNG